MLIPTKKLYLKNHGEFIMRKSTHILIRKRLVLGLLLSGIITTSADARLIDPHAGGSKDSDTKTDVPTSHPPAHSTSEISASTPSSETRSTASANTHPDPLTESTHLREEAEHPTSHTAARVTSEFPEDTQTAEDRASAAELLATQQAEELKRRDAEIAALRAQLEQQRLTQEHQQRKETEVKETQRQAELEAKLDSTLDEFFPHIQPTGQQSSAPLPPPPQPTVPPPPQEPMGINGFLGMVFGQPVENTLNGPGRNFEKFISSAAGRRGREAQQQALSSLFSLFR